MKITKETPQTTVQPATTQSMKKDIKKQELIFQKKLDSVDSSKTKTQKDKWGNTTLTYYDNKGKELYSRTEVSPDAYGGYIYGYTDNDGNRVRFIDNDKDGNMDQMGLTDKNNIPKFQATDKNDDGIFDLGMPCTGKNAGREFDIKN